MGWGGGHLINNEYASKAAGATPPTPRLSLSCANQAAAVSFGVDGGSAGGGEAGEGVKAIFAQKQPNPAIFVDVFFYANDAKMPPLRISDLLFGIKTILNVFPPPTVETTQTYSLKCHADSQDSVSMPTLDWFPMLHSRRSLPFDYDAAL